MNSGMSLRITMRTAKVTDLLKYECPTCDGYIPNNETPGAYPGALSRIDNETEVCSECGTREALRMFFENSE